MKVKIIQVAGRVERQDAKVGPYKKEPGNFHKAMCAAAYYARKMNCRMVVIPGNSYMNKVYHIAQVDEDLKKFCPGQNEVAVGIMEPSGVGYTGRATED